MSNTLHHTFFISFGFFFSFFGVMKRKTHSARIRLSILSLRCFTNKTIDLNSNLRRVLELIDIFDP